MSACFLCPTIISAVGLIFLHFHNSPRCTLRYAVPRQNLRPPLRPGSSKSRPAQHERDDERKERKAIRIHSLLELLVCLDLYHPTGVGEIELKLARSYTLWYTRYTITFTNLQRLNVPNWLSTYSMAETHAGTCTNGVHV